MQTPTIPHVFLMLDRWATRDENDGVDGSCTLRHWRFMMAVVVIGRKEPPHADFHHWSRYREEHFSGAWS